ncbi:hypothetical protein BH23CHL2_BH23CHL2_30340 [soil metagenome]
MSRDEGLSWARAPSIEDFYALTPECADLDKTDTVKVFGTVSGRSRLYFTALHEVEHVEQIKSLGEFIVALSMRGYTTVRLVRCL